MTDEELKSLAKRLRLDWHPDDYERSAADAIESLMAERDALRVLLREAREYTGYAAFYGDRIEADHAADLCARIDAALNKGGGDEPEDK